MPRKPNYGLNKHRKEQDRKAKKDAKIIDRQQRRDERSSPVNDRPGSATMDRADTSLELPPKEES